MMKIGNAQNVGHIFIMITAMTNMKKAKTIPAIMMTLMTIAKVQAGTILIQILIVDLASVIPSILKEKQIVNSPAQIVAVAW